MEEVGHTSPAHAHPNFKACLFSSGGGIFAESHSKRWGIPSRSWKTLTSSPKGMREDAIWISVPLSLQFCWPQWRKVDLEIKIATVCNKMEQFRGRPSPYSRIKKSCGYPRRHAMQILFKSDRIVISFSLLKWEYFSWIKREQLHSIGIWEILPCEGKKRRNVNKWKGTRGRIINFQRSAGCSVHCWLGMGTTLGRGRLELSQAVFVLREQSRRDAASLDKKLIIWEVMVVIVGRNRN